MFALGLIELLFVGVFFILLVIGTAVDRRYYQESPKWWIVGIGAAIILAYFWNKADFTSAWAFVSSTEFWKPVGIYLVAGLAYSVLEFILSVRKMARSHTASWEHFVATTDTKYVFMSGDNQGDEVDGRYVSERKGKYFVKTSGGGMFNRNGDQETEVQLVQTVYRDVFKKAQGAEATDADKKAAEKLLNTYLGRDEYRASDLRKDFIGVDLNKVTYEVEPKINRGRLSSFIGAWTFLWPAYAVSLILGDFLVELFRVIGDAFAKLGGRFVRLTFDGVFKV